MGRVGLSFGKIGHRTGARYNRAALISLIFTVLNEAQSLPALLDSIAAQSRQPDEVVICDGGSTDATLAILQNEQQKGRFCLKILVETGANISRGRNVAIAAAQGPIIACSDAGVRLHPQWLDELTQDLRLALQQQRQTPMATAGFFLPDPHNTFEIAMSATVLPELRDIKAESFLPSSRSVAFLKTAWTRVNGYPEWLDYCEDLIFDFAIQTHCGGFTFAPKALVYFRPRGSLRSFYKQYYLYARGDGKANLWLKRHLIRYATYLIGFPALALGGWLISPWLWLCLLIAGFLYVRTPLRRLVAMPQWPSLSVAERLRALVFVPTIRVVGDIAKMIGYPAGLAWRMTNG